MSSTKTEIPSTTIAVMGRLSYADIFVPREYKKGDGNFKYSVDVLIPKKATTVGGVEMGGPAVKAQILAAIAAAKVEKWGPDTSTHPKLKPAKVCFKDGDSEEMGNDEAAGHWVLRAKDDDAPQTLARNGQPTTQADGLLYSGSYGRVLVNFWAMDNDWGKGVNSNLRAAQHVAHGERFGRPRVDAADLFGSLDDDEGAMGDAFDLDDEIPF